MKTPIFAVLVGLVFSVSVEASEMRGILRNNEGVKQFSGQRADRAMEEFTAALGDLPFSGAVHLNIGNAFLARRDLDKALNEYDQALRSAQGGSREERETRFRALFNSAVIRTEMKQVDEALALYQQALDIYPDSIETKTNMELLAQQASSGGEGEDENDENQGDQKDKKKDQKKDKKEDEGDSKDKEKDQQKEPDKFENPRSTPRPFKSGELSQQDAKRILDEMKRQEEQIRARMQNERAKERPPEKDW